MFWRNQEAIRPNMIRSRLLTTARKLPTFRITKTGNQTAAALRVWPEKLIEPQKLMNHAYFDY